MRILAIPAGPFWASCFSGGCSHLLGLPIELPVLPKKSNSGLVVCHDIIHLRVSWFAFNP